MSGGILQVLDLGIDSDEMEAVSNGQRRRRNPQDQSAELDHVLYEIEMLTHSFLTLAIPQVNAKLSQLERNVWIEVFAIHSRNLNEFFSNNKCEKADMKPDHFVEWQYDYTYNKALKRRASAHVAHLTYDREVPGEKTPWVLDVFFIPLQKQCIRFLQLIAQVDNFMHFQNNRLRTVELQRILAGIQVRVD